MHKDPTVTTWNTTRERYPKSIRLVLTRFGSALRMLIYAEYYL